MAKTPVISTLVFLMSQGLDVLTELNTRAARTYLVLHLVMINTRPGPTLFQVLAHLFQVNHCFAALLKGSSVVPLLESSKGAIYFGFVLI